MADKNNLLEFSRNTFLLKHKSNEEIAKKFDLAPIEVDIIAYLYVCDKKATASCIQRERNIKKNTISIHVENLVQRGYLLREGIENDRRSINLTLTPKAITIAQMCEKENEKLRQKLFVGLTKDEIKVLCHAFEIINQNAKDLINRS